MPFIVKKVIGFGIAGRIKPGADRGNSNLFASFFTKQCKSWRTL